MNSTIFMIATNDLSNNPMSQIDIILFLVSVIGVIAFGIRQGNKDSKQGQESQGAEGYFLAGRGLTWWLVGFSLIAANISTEQFVGMSGQAADWLGMAIASYEWMAAVTLVVTAFVFLPKLLRCGIYTIPEFLEYRYGVFSRSVMAVSTLVILVGVPTASVIYSGAKVVSVFFHGISVAGLDLGSITVGCWIIGLAAAVYVFVGGLKACAWTDLVWGAALIVGGAIVMFLAFGAMKDAKPADLILTKVENSSATVEDLEKASAYERFVLLNDGKNREAEAVAGENLAGGKLHMKRPITDPSIPWTALILGLWIPNFFYWGLNQYIVQRTLGSKSLAEGQKGIVFAAALKLVIPFIVVIPGILCFNLYQNDLAAEAVKKNALPLQDMASGKKVVYPFSENFAKARPELAQQVYAHNAKVAGLDGSSVAMHESPKELQQKNAALIAASKLPQGEKLIGYDYDAAFPILLRNLMKPGITWFVLAAIFGAVVSSLASMLNSAATIATMDVYQKINKNASQSQLVGAGKAFTLLFVLIACVIAPFLGNPAFGGIFTIIQEFQGFISPGILAVFLFGFLSPRSPRYLGWLGILLNIVLYGSIKWLIGPYICAQGWWFSNEISFLDRMGVCFLIIVIMGMVLTWVHPLATPAKLPVSETIVLESSKVAKTGGFAVIAVMVIFYIMFW
jgi:SSS family solute:Na+ symporter